MRIKNKATGAEMDVTEAQWQTIVENGFAKRYKVIDVTNKPLPVVVTPKEIEPKKRKPKMG